MQHDNLTSFFNVYISETISGLIFYVFAKWRKVTLCFIVSVGLSVHPSICPHEQLSSHWLNFHEI